MTYKKWHTSQKDLNIHLYRTLAANWLKDLHEISQSFLRLQIYQRKPTPFNISFFYGPSFAKIQYFLFYKYLIFIMTIPIPSAVEFQLLKPRPIPIHLDFNTDVIFSIYIKPQNSYLAISSNNQSYFTTNENFLNACYQNDFQTFCHPPRSISNTDNNPICETSMFLNSQPYKCGIFISFSECTFLTPLQFHHGWLYSTIFPRQIFLSCRKNSKTVITLPGIGILQIKSGCNLDSSTPYYHLQNHLNIMDNSIPVNKSTTSLAIISPFLYNISIQEPHLLKKYYFFFNKKKTCHYQSSKTMSLSITKYKKFKKLFHLFLFVVHIN